MIPWHCWMYCKNNQAAQAAVNLPQRNVWKNDATSCRSPSDGYHILGLLHRFVLLISNFENPEAILFLSEKNNGCIIRPHEKRSAAKRNKIDISFLNLTFHDWVTFIARWRLWSYFHQYRSYWMTIIQFFSFIISLLNLIFFHCLRNVYVRYMYLLTLYHFMIVYCRSWGTGLLLLFFFNI